MNASQPPETCSPPAASDFHLLSEAERDASLQRTLAGWDADSDMWVFGYGSLVWRPDFEFSEQRIALLHGYHRALCLWSRINRGTPEIPGLVFGLDIGGSCRGMAFRIPAQDVPVSLEALWRREMPSGAYIPKWIDLRTAQGTIKALAFTMDRSTTAYVRDLSKEQLIRIVQNAHGVYGPCVEYVLETAQALKLTGIHDRKLEALVLELQSALAQNE